MRRLPKRARSAAVITALVCALPLDCPGQQSSAREELRALRRDYLSLQEVVARTLGDFDHGLFEAHTTTLASIPPDIAAGLDAVFRASRLGGDPKPLRRTLAALESKVRLARRALNQAIPQELASLEGALSSTPRTALADGRQELEDAYRSIRSKVTDWPQAVADGLPQPDDFSKRIKLLAAAIAAERERRKRGLSELEEDFRSAAAPVPTIDARLQRYCSEMKDLQETEVLQSVGPLRAALSEAVRIEQQVLPVEARISDLKKTAAEAPDAAVRDYVACAEQLREIHGLVTSDDGDLRSWWSARTKKTAETVRSTIEGMEGRLRDAFATALEEFRRLELHARTDASAAYKRAKASRIRYREAVDATRGSAPLQPLAAVFRLESEPLPPVIEFPHAWDEPTRREWARVAGGRFQDAWALHTVSRIATFKDGFWRLRNRPVDMVLVQSKEPSAATFVLMDRHEVTYQEFIERVRRTRMLDPSGPLRDWWGGYKDGIEKAAQAVGDQKLLLFGMSFDAAKQFTRDAYPDLALRLPSSAEWDLAVETSGGLLMSGSALSGDALLEPPVLDATKLRRSGFSNLLGGLSEWCASRGPGEITSLVRGVSTYKPWSDALEGLAAWDHLRRDYFNHPLRAKRRDSYRRAACYGFRCVYDLAKTTR